MKYSRMTYENRCQISALLQAKFSNIKIADILGFHKSTISREIKRNSARLPNTIYKEGLSYHPQVAHKMAKTRFKKCRKRLAVNEKIRVIK